jgi:prepilin-type processing-associated H-X9-DG protein
MGLGVAQYVNVYGRYPPGTIPNPDLPLDRRLGWGIPILTYLDQVSYFEDHGTTLEAAERLDIDDPVFADLKLGITRCPESISPTRTNFVAMAGLGLDAPSLPTNHPRAGIFGDDRRVTPADIKDGTASTMMLSESDNVLGPWFAGGRRTVRGLDPINQPYIGKNRQLGGNHAGGANVLMADGSIKFVSESIDPKILEALSTMAGKETVPADFDDN